MSEAHENSGGGNNTSLTVPMTSRSTSLKLKDVKIVSRYDELREELLKDEYSLHQDTQLAFWALPKEQKLPHALIGCKLGELLKKSFDELLRTPTIGEKKFKSILTLLERAKNAKAEDISNSLSPPKADTSLLEDSDEISIDSISEIQWRRWQAIILDKGLANEPLGRLCPTLSKLTRPIWNNLLSEYCQITLSEVREMRTHGEKRVESILEIFRYVCSIVGEMKSSGHRVQLVPERIADVETWGLRTLSKPDMPNSEEIKDNYILPLLGQLEIDSTENKIRQISENRIGLHGEVISLRQAARKLGMARARIYQLLDEINDILTVRWPNGWWITSLLRNKLPSAIVGCSHNESEFSQFHYAAEIFFPWGRRGAIPEMLEGFADGTVAQGTTRNGDWDEADSDGESPFSSR